MDVMVQALRDYLNCNYKLFLRQQGEIGVPNEYARFVASSRKRFAAQASSVLCGRGETGIVRDGTTSIEELRLGHPLLLGVTLTHDNHAVEVDALKRVAGDSALGEFFYSPVLFHSGESIRKSERLLLALQSFVLRAIQDHLASSGTIISGDSFRLSTVKLESYYARAREILEDVFNISSGKSQPPLILNDHCQQCQYKSLCWGKALAESNLSLLDRIGEKDITKYNNKGIFSLHQLSYTFRYRRGSTMRMMRSAFSVNSWTSSCQCHPCTYFITEAMRGGYSSGLQPWRKPWCNLLNALKR